MGSDVPSIPRAAPELAALLPRLRAREPAAFAWFYRRFVRLVHGVLLARVEAGAVDDLVQDVFAAAARNIDGLKDAEAAGAWLCGIARHKAIDHVRARPPPADELADHHHTAPAPAHDVIDARRALAALRALPEAYRETLTLRLVEGLSGPEIAALTGLTEGSVRVNLHRGMTLLRESLRDD